MLSNEEGFGFGIGREGCIGKRGRWMTPEATGRIFIAVVEEEPLDGAHGAPVFLGGQLFGFVIQVR